jgi:hypothetical protein
MAPHGRRDCRFTEFTLQDSHSGLIVTMQSHIGVPHLLAALGLSMLVFKPKAESLH